ncbi:MAG: ACT domain-containing protein [Candidatus Anstonellales archaeon]
MKPAKQTIAAKVREYVESHPSIKDCISYGVVNYASLGRLICEELRLKQQDAVSMSLRRYKKPQLPTAEKRIISVLRKSSMEVLTNIVVVTLLRHGSIGSKIFELGREISKARNDPFLVAQGSQTFTVITLDSNLERIKKEMRGWVLKVEGNLSLILIKSPEEVESVPGVTAYMLSSLAHHGINVVELVSCWKDTIFVVDEKDTGKAMSALRHSP